MANIPYRQTLKEVFLKVLSQDHYSFSVYINDLKEKLHSNSKLFADDTSLFSTVTGPALSKSHLNNDLSKTNDWAYKWKMSLNPDSATLRLH